MLNTIQKEPNSFVQQPRQKREYRPNLVRDFPIISLDFDKFVLLTEMTIEIWKKTRKTIEFIDDLTSSSNALTMRLID